MIATGVYAINGQDLSSTGLPPGKVVFLEHNLIANGTVENGTVPFRTVNFPSYWFNENTRQLNGDIDFPLDDSLIVIFGDTLALKGNFGAGTGNRLYGIYQLPARAAQATIYYVDKTGTVGLYVNDRPVYLKPGQTYSYNETETVRDGNGIVSIAYQHQFINHGLINRDNIQTMMVA